jgi:hypothetical protein
VEATLLSFTGVYVSREFTVMTCGSLQTLDDGLEVADAVPDFGVAAEAGTIAGVTGLAVAAVSRALFDALERASDASRCVG